MTSVGTASPSSAASVALGLGVPVIDVVKAFYRAPSILVDNQPEQTAQNMAKLLTELGFETKAECNSLPFTNAQALLDVAVYIEDTSRYADITQSLAEFIGSTIDEAAKLISTPPGIVLGSVSPATVKALTNRLGAGVSILASDPTQAIYDLYLSACEKLVSQRIIRGLLDKGHKLIAEEGCLITDLNQKEADQIWQDYQKIGVLRVINREFTRFDIVLTGPGSNTQTPAQIKALTSIVGMPANVIPEVFQNLPITLFEGLPYTDVEATLEKLYENNLEVRADMITFLHVGLKIIATDTPRDLSITLADLGILKQGEALSSMPYQIPYHLPELQARLLRDSLSQCGAQTVFVEASV